MKISKTIKRLRTEKGITQEQLAEMLFISRQSVSSWENDRTQPDLEMLGKLSEVFGVCIEELLYGKKRNVTLETQKPDHNTTLIIVFSILGALLAGTGLVLIFVTFWQKMPVLIKAVLSLLPLMAGQAAGVFVLIKKRAKIPWCEGAGVLWCAGIGATLAMIYNVFEMSFFWENLLIAEALLIIPVVLLLKCTAPIIVYYTTAISWFFATADKNSKSTVFIFLGVIVLLLSSGCIFTNYMIKTDKKSIRSLCAHWISILAVTAFLICFAFNLSGDLILAVSTAGAAGLCLLLLSLKDADITMPYRIPGLFLTALALFGTGASFYGSLKSVWENIIFVAFLSASVLITLGFVLITKTKIKDNFLLIYIVIGITAVLAFSVLSFFIPPRTKSNAYEIFITVMKIVTIAGNILLMISGGKEKKLLPINTGFISVAALTILFVYQSGLSMLVNGILLLIAGAVLLAINYKLSAKPKPIPVTENMEEVQGDE